MLVPWESIMGFFGVLDPTDPWDSTPWEASFGMETAFANKLGNQNPKPFADGICCLFAAKAFFKPQKKKTHTKATSNLTYDLCIFYLNTVGRFNHLVTSPLW